MNQRDRFVDCIDAMGDREINVAGEFAAFDEHRAATPFDEISPHFTDQDKRRVVKLADLE